MSLRMMDNKKSCLLKINFNLFSEQKINSDGYCYKQYDLK